MASKKKSKTRVAKKKAKKKKARPKKKAKKKKATKNKVSKADTLKKRYAVSGVTYAKALKTAKDSGKNVEERVYALVSNPMAICESKKNLKDVLGVLCDKNEDPQIRSAALTALKAASFNAYKFESCRKEYIAALRKVARDDDAALREMALETLAQQKDGYAQKKLLEGLENEDKALVAPAKALQLLSYDIHSDAYRIAKKLLKTAESDDVKREALRLLAADTKSAKLFEKILKDKKETTEVRQMSAAALHSLKPERLYEEAKKIVMDKSEKDDDFRSTCLTALTEFAENEMEDKVYKRVEELKSKASSKVKRSAQRFLKRYSK